MQYVLILMVLIPGVHIQTIPVPGAWTKAECTDGGVNWQARAPKGSSFMCLPMGKDPDWKLR